MTVAAHRGDVRGFVHKRIFGGIKGAIGGFLGGGPVGALGGAARGFVTGGARAPVTPSFAGGCPPGFAPNIRGECAPAGGGFRIGPVRIDPSAALPGGRPFISVAGRDVTPPVVTRGFGPTTMTMQAEDFGDAVKGRFGAALEPAVRDTMTRVCPRGSILAVDGLCYNRRDIRNNERMWPRGRRPLLTGGEMRCISIASSAAKKLQRKQKQLEALGMLKRPARRSAPKALAHHHDPHHHSEH